MYATPEQENPVLYKGRYRPAESYARLWLYEFYHSATLKNSDLHSFQTTSRSPLHLLWALNFLGYNPYQNAPLFWIGSAETKSLGQLSLSLNRFSYNDLYQALYLKKESSEAIIKRLIIYHSLRNALQQPSSSSIQLDLSHLLSGLRMQWQGEKNLFISSLSENSPWPFLKKGMILASIDRTQGDEILKQYQNSAEEWTSLLSLTREFEKLEKGPSSFEKAFISRFNFLKAKNLQTKEIQQILENEFPLNQRLRNAGTLFKVLPSRYQESEWFPIKALTIKEYDPLTKRLEPIRNFTAFSDQDFETIRQLYFDLQKEITREGSLTHSFINQEKLASALQKAYLSLEGKTFQQAHQKQLYFPSLKQLKIETIYSSYPWIPLLIVIYGSAAIAWILSFTRSIHSLTTIATILTLIALLCHSALLLMRSYILGRPPVSNMFETVLYVPWVAGVTTMIFPFFRRQPIAILAACLSSIFLLLILEITNLNQSLDQVQAVLDSQFWLMIHVLLVVGSYGIFILGAIIGHIYMGYFITYRRETPIMSELSKMILQTMYGGASLLLIGTILGGVWAAESWGRFWDWDPKESWAFISICFYLIWIHAYRFHRIASFGLAFGAISGIIAISFTWYGVNYILGTGLHSYGFGSGGEGYYYAFLLLEIIFLILTLVIHYLQQKKLLSSS